MSNPDAQITYEDLNPNYIFTLPNERVVIIRNENFEVWHRLEEKIYSVPVPIWDEYGTWKLSHDGTRLALLAQMQIVKCWDLATGKFLGEYKPDISRPRMLNQEEPIASINPFLELGMWQYDQQDFIYKTPSITRRTSHLQLSQDGQKMVIPSEEGVVLVNLHQPVQVLLSIAIDGSIVATHATETHVFAVTKSGEILAFPYGMSQ